MTKKPHAELLMYMRREVHNIMRTRNEECEERVLNQFTVAVLRVFRGVKFRDFVVVFKCFSL
jgi:hypothetical protein